MDQMDERLKRRQQEKKFYNEQAEIWAKDNQEYNKFEQTRNNQKREVMQQYAKTIKAQMSENAEIKKASAAKMGETEALLNKRLLDELD